jgi:hypothetical protein
MAGHRDNRQIGGPMRRALAVLLSLTLLAPGCATVRSANARAISQRRPAGPDRALLTTYLRQLPIGSKVRARLIGGQTLRGTLMRAADEGIVVQRRSLRWTSTALTGQARPWRSPWRPVPARRLG